MVVVVTTVAKTVGEEDNEIEDEGSHRSVLISVNKFPLLLDASACLVLNVGLAWVAWRAASPADAPALFNAANPEEDATGYFEVETGVEEVVLHV